ncbi:MAG: contractile injection system tape measure protein, partial [Psychrosphaera sp.]|nr:contractile injection system tape measure protein [Psychrosphaera sp.]
DERLPIEQNGLKVITGLIQAFTLALMSIGLTPESAEAEAVSPEVFKASTNGLLNSLQGQAKQRNTLKQTLLGLHTEMVKLQQLLTTVDVEQKQSSDERDEQTQHLMIAGAGIVLAGPYLHRFFDQLGLLKAPEGQAFGSTEQARRAVQLLHYLVFEQFAVVNIKADQPPVLFNLICGLPEATEPLPDIALTDEEQLHCQQLLLAMCLHWPAMKGQTPADLRQHFLSRQGQLTEQSNQWLVVPQPEPDDLQLKSLPWGISTLKLPWMTQPLAVDWRNHDR